MHNEISHIIQVLKKGGVILYPTDTIWGIGCDATNLEAIQKIKHIKQRDDRKALLVLCESMQSVKEYVCDFPEKAIDLEQTSEKPITIIYPQIKNIPNELLAEDGSLGIRIPRFDFCIDLLKAFQKPIVSTSANISGTPPPFNYNQISKQITQSVDYIVKDFHNYITPFSGSKIVKINTDQSIDIIRE